MIRINSRGLTVSTRRFQTLSKIGSTLKTKEDIRNALNLPVWSLKELISSNEKDMKSVEVSAKTINKVLKLSAFDTNITAEQEKSLVSALSAQMVFIKHLYENDEKSDSVVEENDTHFRLIASDHNPGEPLTLKQLLAQIEELPEKVDPAKGETQGSFNVANMNPRNRPFATIRSKQGWNSCIINV